MECFHCILDHEVLLLVWIVLVVESQTPGRLIFFPSNANCCVELNSDRQAPFQVAAIELEPHRVISVKMIWWSIRVKQGFDIIQNIEQVVLSGSHQLYS